MKLTYGVFLLFGSCGLAVLAGCPSVPDEDKGKREMEEECQLHTNACMNNCERLALGRSCKRCCDKNSDACQSGRDTSFSACTK